MPALGGTLTGDPDSLAVAAPITPLPRQDEDDYDGLRQSYELQMELSRKAQDDAAKQMEDALERQLVRLDSEITHTLAMFDNRGSVGD